jgi:cytochrome c peroxidase
VLRLLNITFIGALCLTLGCSGSDDGKDGESPASSVSDELALLCADDLKISVSQCEELAHVALPDALPPAAGNRFADDEEAALLGFRIFYDPRISNLKDVRCATCHQPELYFADRDPVPEVVPGRPGLRNSPSILTAAWMQPFVFWDGRADSLWSQPLFAFEHPDEMDSSRLQLAHVVNDDPEYNERYQSIFGELPALGDTARFPASGKPGDPTFDGMSTQDQESINRLAANVGKALEAYMRKVAIGPGNLERYLAGDREALSVAARQGLATFVTSGCIDCHAGPALSDGNFYRIGSTAGDDPGRAAALDVLRENPFNLDGPYADPEALPGHDLPLASSEADMGAFRTPSLRAVSLTAPYGHAGQYPTLKDLLSDHGTELDAEQLNALQVLLLTLEEAYPQRPWSDWPVL